MVQLQVIRVFLDPAFATIFLVGLLTVDQTSTSTTFYLQGYGAHGLERRC